MPSLKKTQPKPPILFKLWAEKCLFHSFESTKCKLTFLEPTKGTSLSRGLSFHEIFNHAVSDRNIRIIKKGWVYVCLQAWRCNSKYNSSNKKHSEEKSTKCLPNDLWCNISFDIRYCICLPSISKAPGQESWPHGNFQSLCSISLGKGRLIRFAWMHSAVVKRNHFSPSI